MDDEGGTASTDDQEVVQFAHARNGDHEALAALRSRHRATLRAVAAGYLTTDSDPDVVVEDAFAHLGDVAVPTSAGAVSLTLMALVREAAGNHAVANGGERPLGLVDLTAYGERSNLTAARRGQLLDAFAELSDRDQALLWFSAVEGASPTDLDARLPIASADAAATAVHRARSRLRTALVSAHLAESDVPESCRGFMLHLAALADGTLTGSREATLREHAEDCRHCQGLLADLSGISSSLLGLAAPIVHQAAAELPLAAWTSPLGVAAGATTTARATDVAAGRSAAASRNDVAATPSGDGPPVHAGRAERAREPLAIGAKVRAALVVLAAIVVLGVIGYGLTRDPGEPDPNELAVVAGDTTIAKATTTYESVYADEDRAERTAPRATSAKDATTTTKAKSSGRPSRGSTDHGGNSGGSGGGSDGGVVLPPATDPAPTAPATSTATTRPAATTTTTLPALAVHVEPPGPGGAGFAVTVTIPSGTSTSGKAMRLELDGDEHFRTDGVPETCRVPDGAPSQPQRLVCSLEGLVGGTWTRSDVAIQAMSSNPDLTATLVTPPGGLFD